MKKYGLQLRAPQSTSTKKALPPPKKPSIFNQDDDDEDNVEKAIARQAAKNRALKEVELQHKAALEQDSTVFAYDEVYDDLKIKSTTSRLTEQEHNKPKYITKLLDKAKVRQQEQEIIYERKLLKERQQEDHLYGDKDKFVTSAYKKKLAEQAKWLEEERLKELREQAAEVTNKGDLSDFYHNLLSKNVAFGAKNNVAQEGPQCDELKQEGLHQIQISTKVQSQSEQVCAEAGEPSSNSDLDKSSEPVKKVQVGTASLGDDNGVERRELESLTLGGQKREPDADKELHDGPRRDFVEEQNVPGKEELEKDDPGKDLASGQPNPQTTDRKPSEEALAAAKERFLARKRVRTT